MRFVKLHQHKEVIPINPVYKRLLDVVGKFIENGYISLNEWYDLKNSHQYLNKQCKDRGKQETERKWKIAEIKNKC